MFKAIFLFLAVAGACRLAGGEEEPGWYLVTLNEGETITARLIEEQEDHYVLKSQGSIQRLSKTAIKKLERLSRDPLRPEQDQEGVSRDELLDAVEALASDDTAAVKKAFKLLSGKVNQARAMLHGSLRHQSDRVRGLVLKLLGEKGTAGDDLEAVSDRLWDKKPAVRLAAGMAIRALGPEGLPRILEYLRTEPVPNNRKIAIKTLEQWKDPRAVPVLVELLNGEPHEGVRGFLTLALEALTRRSFGSDPEAWNNYLLEQGTRDEPPEAPEGAQVPDPDSSEEREAAPKE